MKMKLLRASQDLPQFIFLIRRITRLPGKTPTLHQSKVANAGINPQPGEIRLQALVRRATIGAKSGDRSGSAGSNSYGP